MDGWNTKYSFWNILEWSEISGANLLLVSGSFSPILVVFGYFHQSSSPVMTSSHSWHSTIRVSGGGLEAEQMEIPINEWTKMCIWLVASQICFIFTPKIGEDEPNLTNIFQVG